MLQNYELCLPSYHGIHNMEWESFLCLGKVPYAFLSLDKFLALYPSHFQYREISPRFSLMWLSASVTFSWTSSSFPLLPPSSFVLKNITLSSLATHLESHEWQLFLPQFHLCSIQISHSDLPFCFYAALLCFWSFSHFNYPFL